MSSRLLASLLISAALPLCVVGCRSAAEPTTLSAAVLPPADDTPPLAGRLVFVSERHGQAEIHALDLATGTTTRITNDPAANYIAAVSPDGRTLLTVRAEDTPAGDHIEQLQLMDLAAGATPRSVGPSSKHVRNPSWLPNGGGVLFESDAGGFRDLYRLADGTARRLTHEPKGCYQPTTDPSGEILAFACSGEGDTELYRRPIAGGQMLRLTHSSGADTDPAWSPDGERIAYLSTRGRVPQVYLMAANGARPRPLTANLSPSVIAQRDIAWSPRGDAIALSEQREGTARVIVVRVADGAILARTSGSFVDEMPSWSPDGEALAFVSNRDGDTELYTMQRHGDHLRRLTRSPGPDWLPHWTR